MAADAGSASRAAEKNAVLVDEVAAPWLSPMARNSSPAANRCAKGDSCLKNNCR
jgi:hypothetical protein